MARRDDRRRRRRRHGRYSDRRSVVAGSSAHVVSSSGFGFRTAARYVVRGRVFELAEQRVVARLGLQLRDAAVRIVQVAEHDRLGRAGLLAGGLDLAVADAAVLASRRRSCARVDALHAVGALLHDAAAAHRDVGIAPQLEARRVPVLIEQEVEAAHLVRAVVRAVPRADAAVVDHVVQAFVAVRPSRRPGRPARTARSRTACTAPAGSTSRGCPAGPR